MGKLSGQLGQAPTTRAPRRRAYTTLAAATVVVLSLVAAACGNSSTGNSSSTSTTDSSAATVSSGNGPANSSPGVSATQIDVGGVASVTNPLGGEYGNSFKGVQAYFDMINSQGGIYGRKLVLSQKLDDNLSNNQSQVTQLLNDDVFAVLPVAVLLFTGADELVKANMPTFGWTINDEWQGTPANPKLNMFGESGSYLGITDATPVLPWLAQEKHAHKVGLLAYNVAQSAECAEGAENSFKKYGGEADAKVAFEDKSLTFGISSMAVQVSKMKAAGVDLVATCMDTNGVVTLAKEMKKQGLNAPQYLPDGYDQKFLDSYGDLFQGSVVRTDFTQFQLPADQQPPGLKNYLKWIKTQNVAPSEDSMNGWLNADLFYNGLKAAGPDFTRQSVMDAINKMTRYQADGLLQGVDWTTAHDSPGNTYCQFLSTIQDSKYVPNFSQPGKPFVCVVSKDGKLSAQYAS